MDDEEAVTRSRAGDEDAFAALVTRYTPLARRTAHLLGAGDDAEDAVQEAFTKAYRGLGGFREGAAFKPWLLRIVANETRNLHRSGIRRTRREDFVRNGVALLERGADEEVLAAITREGLLEAVKGLPEQDRAVIVCRYFLDLSEAETAEVLGLPRGTVKSRHSRALAKLRRAAAALALVLAALGVAAAVSPQVRAAIKHVLHFAGVEFRKGSAQAPPTVPPGPAPTFSLPGEQRADLATARAEVGFAVVVPAGLGPLDHVTVSDDARVVSLFFHGGAVRLDEFNGEKSHFAKTFFMKDPIAVTVGGAPGYWAAGPQEVVYIGRDGQDVTATGHPTDGTLVWQTSADTFRLEGIPDMHQAISEASG